MTLPLLNIEFFLLILVRITGFLYTAPFFSLKDVPFRVKTGLSIFITLIIFQTIPYTPPEYIGVIGYAIIVAKEALAGAIMGLFANIAYYILSFAGHMIDLEIGFSMVNSINPVNRIQSSITSNLYGYFVMLLMIITNLHHYFLTAIIDSFQIIAVGDAVIHTNLYHLMLRFITNYFIIGFRIMLPVLMAILLLNTVLAILAKAAPQINMFVIGLQLKVFVGLVVLSLIIGLIPSVADFIFNEMMEMLKAAVNYMKPT